MLRSLFAGRKKETLRCSVLYNFDFDRRNTRQLYDLLLGWLREELKAELKFASFYDETYDEKYGSFKSIADKIVNMDWPQIESFAFYDEDLRKGVPGISLEFVITRPISIIITAPDGLVQMNLRSIVDRVISVFRPVYGLSYSVEKGPWAVAYAGADWQHVDKSTGIPRISKEVFVTWRKNCEKIETGFIRDVYEESILGNCQLAYPLGKADLAILIRDEHLGKIEEVSGGVFIWKLDGEQISRARQLIYSSDILI